MAPVSVCHHRPSQGYDEPETLSCAISSISPTGADGPYNQSQGASDVLPGDIDGRALATFPACMIRFEPTAPGFGDTARHSSCPVCIAETGFQMFPTRIARIADFCGSRIADFCD
jgi:hypothetical protein